MEKTNKNICPHINCLVYHPDGVCNCDMRERCPECQKETKIIPQEKTNKNWDKEIYEILDMVDPDNFRLSEDNRIFIKDEFGFLLSQSRTQTIEEIKGKIKDILIRGADKGEDWIKMLWDLLTSLK